MKKAQNAGKTDLQQRKTVKNTDFFQKKPVNMPMYGNCQKEMRVKVKIENEFDNKVYF